MPAYEISIVNRQRAVPIDRRTLRSLARATLAMEGVSSAEISVAFVSDAEIHEINRNFLNHDFPTDVISFLLEGDGTDLAGAAGTVRRGANRVLDGEIVISTETAAHNASRHQTTTSHELALYLVHGLLHLCGYDDLTPREKRLMRRREAEALLLLDVPAPKRAPARNAPRSRPAKRKARRQ
ncbi:MAG: rRNA maturation RNase YbeY [Planctomycetes bacterium]|nr:rRNA maturation RNase YbeY [Planctomycetota bacterium]